MLTPNDIRQLTSTMLLLQSKAYAETGRALGELLESSEEPDRSGFLTHSIVALTISNALLDVSVSVLPPSKETSDGK